jgi:TM2 domain-containing membrane protein YozV
MIAFLLLIFGQSIEFAKHLEEEGDLFRAIYEYKRVYFETKDSTLRDSAATKIAYLSLKIGSFNDALLYAERISEKDPLKRIKLGFPNLYLGNYKIAENYWQDNDTLLTWLYLKSGQLDKAKLLFPNLSVNRKSPFLGGFLSVVVPGAGKIYAGRVFDGIVSLIVNASTGYSAYRAYRNGRGLEFYLYSSLFLIFYLGDVYGSYVAVNEYNSVSLEKTVKDFEVRFNVWKYWF